MQTLIVVLILLAALGFLGQRGLQTVRAARSRDEPGGGGCGGGGGGCGCG